MHSNMPQSEQEKHAAGKKRLDGAGGGWDISDTKLFKFDSIMCRCVWHAVAVAESLSDSETRRLRVPYLCSGLLLNSCRNKNSVSSESPSNVGGFGGLDSA